MDIPKRTSVLASCGVGLLFLCLILSVVGSRYTLDTGEVLFRMRALQADIFLLGTALLLHAGISRLFPKVTAECCKLPTTLLSVSMSGTTAVCGVCWLYSETCDPEAYPIRYPVSIAGLIVGLVAGLLLLILYILARKKTPGWKGIVLDVPTACLYLPFFALTMLQI